MSRIIKLKEKLLSNPYEICIERPLHYTESYKQTENQPPAIRAAKAFAHHLENLSIFIDNDELLVGNRTSKKLGVIIPIERGDAQIILELEGKKLTRRNLQRFEISDEEFKILKKEVFPYWRNNNIARQRIRAWINRGLIKENEIWAYYKPSPAIDSADVQGHLILGHDYVIKNGGFKGLKKRAEENLKQEKDIDKQNFYRALIICCEAAINWGKRYAKLALELSKKANLSRKNELLKIVENCKNIPENAPKTFYEAVQMIWFIQCLAHISYGMATMLAVGRLDQILYSYYINDIENNIITKERAQELIEELLIKLSSSLVLFPKIIAQYANALGDDLQTITIGGIDKNGEDVTNELSYMILDAAFKVKPIVGISIRVHKNTPKSFLNKALEGYKEVEGNYGAFYNDEIIIPALIKTGVSLEDSRDYAIIGCVEPSPSGNCFPTTGGNTITLPAALEYTLNNGRSQVMVPDYLASIETGDPRQFRSFSEFLKAFKKQLIYNIKYIVDCVDAKDEVFFNWPNPFLSLLVEGCIQKGKDIVNGGAKYNFGSVTVLGAGTLFDSLIAIKKMVYDENIISIDEIIQILNTNFEDHEEMRQILINRVPKYGTDDDSVDFLAKEINEFICKEISKHKTKRGGIYRPNFVSYGVHCLNGSLIGATPDGRKSRQPLSNGISPTNHRELKGPTAVFKSVAKLDHSLISSGSALNMRIHPVLIKDEDSREKLIDAIGTYFSMGGMHIQFNIVTTETLKNAQKNPENYKDLVVRVSGYNALFCDLGKPLQDDIINRTEFLSF